MASKTQIIFKYFYLKFVIYPVACVLVMAELFLIRGGK